MIRLLVILSILVQGLFACALCSFYTPSADVAVDFKVEKETIKRLDIRWDFTNKFTSEILKNYDENHNQKVDDAEWEKAKIALIDYIQLVHYLTTIKLYNESDSAPSAPIDFRVSSWEFRLIDNQPVFTYSIPLERPIEHGMILSVQLTDEGKYFDFMIRQVRFQPSDAWKFEQNLNNDAAFFSFYDKSRYIARQIAGESPTLPMQVTNDSVQEEPAKNPFIAFLERYLKALSDAINDYVTAINETGSFLSYFWLLLFSLLYGILHAAGPGHGKSLVASYFMAHDHSYAKAFSVSFMIAAVHTFSAFVSTLIIYFILHMFFAQFFADLTFYTTKISALLIIAIALYLLYKKLPKKPKGGTKWSAHPPTCSCGSCNLDTATTDLGVIISAGIIPCPGTVTIFILTLSLGEYFVGFLSAVFMSIGMSLIILLAATLSIGVRNRLTGRFSGLSRLLDYGSLAFILLLGISLLFVDMG